MSHVHSTILASLAIASLAWADPPTYTLEFLGPGVVARSINHLGDVAGHRAIAGTTIAHVVLSGQAPLALPVPAGFVSSSAYDINEGREIVGVVSMGAFPSLGSTIPCVWRPTPTGYVAEVLSPLPGDAVAYAIAINNQGDIVGGSGGLFGNSFGVLWTTGGPVKLDAISAASDINDERVVLSGLILLDLDTMTTQVIQPPTNKMASGVRLNSSSNFCGTITGFGSSCASFPARHMQGSGWEVLGGCANQTGAYSINDLNDVTTYYNLTQAAWVRLEGEGDFAIASLIAPGQGPWLVTGSGLINNQRQIVIGGKDLQTSQTGALLLTPEVACYPDCDGNGSLNIFDYICFGNAYSAQQPYADCDGNGSFNIFDYICFGNGYSTGCP